MTSTDDSLGEILERSLNEIYLFDVRTLRFIRVNEGGRLNLGYSMDEFRALTPLDIKPQLDEPRFEALLAPLRRGEVDKVRFESVLRRKDGSEYPAEVHIQLVTYDSQAAFVAIVLDISERLASQRALEESHSQLELRVEERTSALRETEERYRDLFDNAHDLIQGADADSKLVFVNPAWLKTLEYEERGIEGLSVLDVVHPESQAHCRDVFARVIQGEAVDDIRATFVTRTGRPVYVEGSASCRFVDGRPVSTRAIFHDVTQRHLAEEEVRQALRLAEQATETKSRFLAAASHDLRQPLQAIGMYTAALSRLVEVPEQREIVDKVELSLATMGELLDALLDISRLDKGAVIPRKRAVRLHDVIERVAAENGPQARQKGLGLEVDCEDVLIHTDPVLFERILNNLVANAIHYTPCGRVRIEAWRDAADVRVAVIDTGIGIPEQAVERVFEEYYQLDNTARSRDKGLGLGLSIVERIARLLDHPLEVSSKVAEGSTFAVRAPLASEAEAEARAPAPVPRSAKGDAEGEAELGLVVLLVDDDPAVADATALVLRATGCDVHSAPSGEDALAQIENGVRPDVLISDYRLPGVNGLEVVRKVRHATAREVPSILLTGDTSGSEIEAADIQRCAVIHKPFDADGLIDLLHDMAGP